MNELLRTRVHTSDRQMTVVWRNDYSSTEGKEKKSLRFQGIVNFETRS